jgi:magnesium transporter
MRRTRRHTITDSLRELARNRPEEAAEYLDNNVDEWVDLANTDPHNAADILEAIGALDAAEYLTSLDPADVGEIFDEMNTEVAADIVQVIDPTLAARIVAEMDTDQAADLIADLEPDTYKPVYEALDPEARSEIEALLHYPPDSAGGIMTPEFGTLPKGLPAGEAIETLRQMHADLGANLVYIYVVDGDGRLEGVVSFRELVFARPGQSIEEVMVKEPISVQALADREIVSELIQRYHLLAIPVVNPERKLVGIVRVAEAMDAVAEEATEDIAQMVGAGAEESVHTPVSRSVARRQPWLVVNLFMGVLIAASISPFREIIETNTSLALLMPMVALLGGNSGAQSLAVVIRAMALGDLPPGRASVAIRREVMVGVANAVTIGILSAFAAALVAGSRDVGVVMLAAVVVNMLVAGLAGAGIPVALRRAGLDPALASNIFLTMITDIVGFVSFLLTAQLLL